MRHLLFHKSISTFSFASTNFSPRRLKQLLMWLRESGFSFAGIDAQGRASGRSVGFTFDDGYEHLAQVLPPLIEEFGIRPVIFVPTAFIGKPADWDYSYRFCKVTHLERRSIRSLSAIGVEFGSHGHSHTDLTALPTRKMEMELRQSRDILADITGKTVRSIGYPFGRVNSRVVETAEQFGLVHGFTSTFPDLSDAPSTIGRVSIYGYDTLLSITLKLSESRALALERLKCRITNRLSGGTVLLNRMRRYT
jgi:peptidoglycan/xylan/chitin deacetylase (PgdA/CDA1 family)